VAVDDEGALAAPYGAQRVEVDHSIGSQFGLVV
jgi:hypothetical protein